MMLKYLLTLGLFCGLSSVVSAQTSPWFTTQNLQPYPSYMSIGSALPAQSPVTPTPAQPVTQAWSMSTSAVALPGGKGSIAGVDSGITFTPSANFDIFDRNLISSDNNLQYFAGGVSYRLPALSTKANNASQNVNFLRVRFSLLASFGVARVFQVNHYGYTAGVGVDYSLTKSGSWTFGGSGEYAQFPGYGSHSIIKVNAAFHF